MAGRRGKTSLLGTNQRAVVQIAGVLAAAVVAGVVFGPIVTAEPRHAVTPDGPDGARFGLSPRARREVFDFVASVRPEGEREARETFPGHAWSQQDHLAWAFWNRSVAAEHHFSLSRSVIHAIVEEGIRQQWRPTGSRRPLDASVVPLELRK